MDKAIFEQNTAFYVKVYVALIERAKHTIYPKWVYTEKHHIIPKALGGSDDPINLVRLTAREHIFVHLLLHRIYPDSFDMAEAVNCMFYFTKSRGDRKEAIKTFSSKTIGRIREDAAKAFRENHPDMSEEARQRLRELRLDTKLSVETRIKISNAGVGRKLSEETIEKVRKALTKPITPESTLERVKRSPFSRRVKAPDGNIYLSPGDCSRTTGVPVASVKLWSREERNGYSYLDEHVSYRKVQGPDGKIYENAKQCASAFGVTDSTVRRRIKVLPEMGFKYVD